jgi:hypothetical protein
MFGVIMKGVGVLMFMMPVTLALGLGSIEGAVATCGLFWAVSAWK